VVYKGLYHVLHGHLTREGIGPQNLRIDELIQRVRNNKVREIILATKSQLRGRVHRNYIKSQFGFYGCACDRSGPWSSMGGDLEYADGRYGSVVPSKAGVISNLAGFKGAASHSVGFGGPQILSF